MDVLARTAIFAVEDNYTVRTHFCSPDKNLNVEQTNYVYSEFDLVYMPLAFSIKCVMTEG